MPTWGIDLSQLDMDQVKYYVRSTERPTNSWDDLPEDNQNTYDRRRPSPKPNTSVWWPVWLRSTNLKWFTTRSVAT